MIEVREQRSIITGYDSKKVVCCPACGYKHTFYYASPESCAKCDEELPDLIEMMESNLARLKKLEYHNTGKTQKRFH